MTPAALITGASRGIGAAIAEEMHRRGYFVYLLGRDEQALDGIRRRLPASEVILCDLSHGEQVSEAAWKATVNRQHTLTVLINNAGIFQRHSTPEGDDALWMSHFQTNMMGPVRLTRALWPHFTQQKQGSIVNISSTLGLKPTADTSAYSALKAALVNWTSALALEGGPLGIRVNCVCPGLVDTPIHSFHGLPPARKTEVVAQLGPLQPLGRIGTPEEIARAVGFLADQESALTTGAILSVDGGIHIA